MKPFIILLQKFYTEHKRSSLPWRKTRDLYQILLSEIMLQQTQVSRVLIKYIEFLNTFPTIQTLADAPLRQVLIAWQGLGYNRRAKFLHEASKQIVSATKAELSDYTFLNSLPGVGQSTAGAILAFTENKPVAFIETNIRAVILHHFFKNEKKVSDVKIKELLEKILLHLPKDFGPRDFYYAMYDYGTVLKQTLGKDRKTLHSKSVHYTKQSRFEGSRRQLRAFILKTFLRMKSQKNFKTKLITQVLKNKPKSLCMYTRIDVASIIEDLTQESMLPLIR